jgi:hypothetical protein
VSSHRQRLRDTARILNERRRLDAPARAALKQERKERAMPSGPVRLKTAGLNPKVPVQAIATLIVAALAHFGLDLDDELSAALAVVIGFAAGYIAPPAPTVTARRRSSESGQGLIELVVVVLVILILVFVLLRVA